MFKNEFQGGPYVEVFSAQVRDATNNWKLTGGVKKIFEREVKSYIYVLDGNVSTSKMELPKDSRQTLSLIQRFFMLQLFVPKGKDFSIDIGVTDLSNNKRRIKFSTTHKETQSNPLHVKLPLGILRKGIWLNLCLDLLSIVGETWKGETFKSIESICISANCKVRRIFTMKNQSPDTTSDEALYDFTGTNENIELDSIPKQCQLAPDVIQETQVINMTKVRHFEAHMKAAGEPVTARSTLGSDLDLNSSGGRKSMNSDSYHIAFGTKVAGKDQKKVPGKESNKDGNLTSRTSKSNRQRGDSYDGHTHNRSHKTEESNGEKENRTPRDRKNSDPGANLEDPEVTVDKESLKTSKTWTDGADGKEPIPFVKPHPPRGPSHDRARRKPRVKSAGKERTPHVLPKSDDLQIQSVGSSAQSSTQSSCSNSQISINNLDKPQPKTVANQEEVARILQAMKDQKDESDSEKSNEDTSTSDAFDDDGDESVSELISTLKGADIGEGNEYEESEGDESHGEEENRVYTYSSAPTKAPWRTANGHKDNKTSVRTHRTKVRKKSEDRLGASTESDFLGNCSSEEEESLRTRIKKHSPHSRANKHSRSAQRELSRVKKSPKNGLLHVPGLSAIQTQSPHTSQTRMSISRKSLREIPKDDVRLSQPQKPYNVSKYQMEDLSESFEQNMLLSLQRQTLEDGIEESEDDKKQSNQPMRDFHYGNDSLSNSSDDTSMSTLKAPGTRGKSHNYQDEMKLASAKLNQDFLNQSNPRDWGSVFSPPIVLPSEIAKGNNSSQLSPGNIDMSKTGSADLIPNTETAHSDDEQELDLLYDPVLNCYFDPKSCKYYELC